MGLKIGLVLGDSGFENLDLRFPELGNNGIGGTQYCFLMLARYLKLYNPEIDVDIIHYSNNILPGNTHSYIVKNEKEALTTAREIGVDLLIIRSVSDYGLKLIEQYNINTIIWAHNYLFADELNRYCNNKYIKRVVFVGRQQYDCYIDHPIIEKAIYIYNMFEENNDKYRRNNNYDLNVTYTGSLISSKGFHILAKEWKKILKKVPNAKLNIIGSGQLYDRSSSLGKYKIADELYEKKFMPYLLNDNGEILESVRFYGVLGYEKVNIYNNTAVGIINPSGRTETFGLSAVEMEACGIPIVTKATNGLLDTIINNKTGLLSKNKLLFRDNIIRLLLDKDLNEKLGNQAKLFVGEAFNPKVITEKWCELFNEIIEDRKSKYIQPGNYYLNNFKFIRILNKKIKEKTNYKYKISVIEIENQLKTLIKNFRNNI